ncbi:MAG: hypothetical protein HYZ36_06790, partial [Pedosphaera parvula]|nr:hypothetical protein [Pedosphaera parvula]
MKRVLPICPSKRPADAFGCESLLSGLLIPVAFALLLASAAVADAAETKTGANQFPAKSDQEWQSLFDGRTLNGWRPTDFAGHGSVEVERGRIVIGMGEMLSGVNWTNDLPRMDYELSLEAMKLDGSDF